MSVRKAVQDGLVAFLRVSCGLNATQVKVDRHGGTKKSHPHLVLTMPIGPQMLGTDTVEIVVNQDTDVFEMQTSGDRRMVVSVHGYGDEAFDWIEEAVSHLSWGYPGNRELRKHGLSVEPIGHTLDVSTQLETSIQPHYIREFQVLFGIKGEPVAVPEAKTITVDFNNS